MSMTCVPKTPLEAWIARKIGADRHALSREQIQSHQLQKLWETIRMASVQSPFYRDLLKGADLELSSLADLGRFPFTTAEDIREHSVRFLCVSQDDIGRVVTLDTSGTTGNPKRLYFTRSDQELTIDFFQQGMSTLVEKGDRVLILLPGERAGSVGDLLASALKRSGVTPVPHGVVRNIQDTLTIMGRETINSLVGIPVQVLALARYADAVGIKFRLKSVLLSTDNVPGVIIKELRRLWDCRVFEHYGMTEMGLGGGVECEAHDGYHLREADLYFEIVDDAGGPLSEGKQGEVVFTTLTQQGMPLIRYRTGDISRFLPGPCECGSILRRLDKIAGRKKGPILIDGKRYFDMPELDEGLFEVPGVINFTAQVDNARRATKLIITALMASGSDQAVKRALSKGLNTSPAICEARRSGRLKVVLNTERCEGTLPPPAGKRYITESN